MRSLPAKALTVLAMTLVLRADACLSFNDAGVIAVNIENLTGLHNITPGTVSFINPDACTTKQPAQYLDSDYGLVVGGRLVDIRYKANGTFNASVNNGSVTINGTRILSYSGPWSSLTTEQSLLTSPLMNPDPAGTAVLINAVQNNLPITLCITGNFTSAAPPGLSVQVDIYAQVDVNPD